ncbi:Uncharacterised protein [Yersinia pseudotuberculosis]|uniref:hypothetical protein n=1 Tax=Yersinia pseudotuberculosis TaxID=633 RepID=UPI0005DEF084|nr:hypothetical protein [Yersinia pseudotuberculosis]CNL19681.1 Uncharacterised protein [Yersinia pseudotuberculosis]
MTVVYTYAASDNSRNRRKTRRAEQREANPTLAAQPVSRVARACISVPARSTERPSADNICLPQVAKFAAGFRNVREDCYHVIK